MKATTRGPFFTVFLRCAACAAFCLGVSGPVHAQGAEEYITRLLPQQQISADDPNVLFITGGDDNASQTYLRSLEREYNSQFVFVQKKTGAYLADVNVTISDKAEADKTCRVFLRTKTEGPFLLVQLPPGRYSVTADYRDEHQTFDVRVAKGKSRKQYIYFNAPDAE